MPRLDPSDSVSRLRYQREQQARKEAERLLDEKSRALWEANQSLKSQAEALEQAVLDRTADLSDALVAAQASDRAKTTFLATMSHEVRTPLNGVLGMAEVMLDTNLNTEQRQMAQTIVESGEHLLAVLNDVLDIAKVEAGQLEIEHIRFEPREMISAVEHLYGARAQDKALQFEVDVSDAVPQALIGDPLRIRQVVGNLISNAIKFTEAGHIKVKVDLPENKGKPCMEISVDDTGQGIAQETLGDLFKPFHQLDASVARKHGGSGLGLTISQRICRLMGGDIVVDSTPGIGSVFTARFTVAMATEATNTPKDFTDLAEEVLGRIPWRLLVVDDNRTNLLVLKKFLKPYDLNITTATEGRAALGAFQSMDFDLILMDINMPEMSGVEATRAIRDVERKEGRTAVPILALTANSMTHQVKEYLSAGMNGHIAKPVKKAILLQSIAKVLDPSARDITGAETPYHT